LDVKRKNHRPTIILITGHPGTGKTTLAEALSDHFAMPLITKDAFKERMFDTLGYSDKAWSLKVSSASHRIIDYLLEQELAASRSLILESNFKPECDDQRFQQIRTRHPSFWIQVLCWAQGDVLFERYMTRQEGAERHPGHVEVATPKETRLAMGSGRADVLTMPDVTFELDTTDLSAVAYDGLIRQIDDARKAAA
jgi:cytidylate kinase